MSLEAIEIKKSYADFSISLDFSVAKGETLALVGPSGSGKTTALNLVAGLAEMESGKLLIDGEDAGALPCWKRNISVVFQDLALFPHLDVGGNISYGLFVRRVPKNERKKIVDSALELVRLQGYTSRRIHTLSGGEKQRVAIARALACRPRAFLLDEPFSSLDAPLRKEMRREFLEIRSRSEAPCIFVTHDREEAAMLGDRLALMTGGRIIETGTARELFLAPETEFGARFFGAGQVLPCSILGKRETGTEVESSIGILTVPQEFEFNPAEPKLFIPHDAMCLGKSSEAGWKAFSVKCTGVIFEGSKLVVKILLSGGESLEMNTPVRTSPPVSGSEISLWVDQSLLRFVR
jgi:ABC-type Fe3+/spermidine/putrescine transport system ATPase subunit